MKIILAKRITLLLTLLIHIGYVYITWQMYEAENIDPPSYVYLVSFSLLILFVVVSIFRCRSLNWSGWRVLAYLVPIVGIILLLLLLIKKPINSNYFKGELIASNS